MAPTNEAARVEKALNARSRTSKRRIRREIVQKRNITVAPLATAESIFIAHATRVGLPRARNENKCANN